MLLAFVQRFLAVFGPLMIFYLPLARARNVDSSLIEEAEFVLKEHGVIIASVLGSR